MGLHARLVFLGQARMGMLDEVFFMVSLGPPSVAYSGLCFCSTKVRWRLTGLLSTISTLKALWMQKFLSQDSGAK